MRAFGILIVHSTSFIIRNNAHLVSMETTPPHTLPEDPKEEVVLVFNKKTFLKAFLVMVFLWGLLTAYPYGISFFAKMMGPKYEVKDVILQSTTGKDVKPLQDFLVKQLQDGKNDDNTKAAIFWLSHRFFDNGGDIYELYNFVNAHPEVAFLKEAERLYPDEFAYIRDGKAKHYDVPSTIALLGYFEMAYKHNYANISMLGLSANKYAELSAEYATLAKKATSTEISQINKKVSKRFVKRSITFSIALETLVASSTQKTGKLTDLETLGLRDDDLLIGLNQFASAQYFYRGLGLPRIVTKFTPEEIFAFNVNLAKTKVPRLYFFTNYVWATSNVNAKQVNAMTVSVPLDNVIEYGKANKDKETGGTLARLIHSNTNGEGSVFSKSNTVALANAYKPFKDWLMTVGWKDSDFK